MNALEKILTDGFEARLFKGEAGFVAIGSKNCCCVSAYGPTLEDCISNLVFILEADSAADFQGLVTELEAEQ